MTVPSNVKTSKPKNSWGIRLSGEQCVQDMLKDELRKPNDPYVEEVISDQGTYLVLRAKAFNDIDNAKDVYTAAEKMLKSLNGIAKLMWHSSPINFDTVVALSDLDQPKRHVFIKIDAIKTVSRGNPVRISEIDREGNAVEPLHSRSKLQRWLEAAQIDDRIALALEYYSDQSDWIRCYKAFEALDILRRLPAGITKREKDRFTQTCQNNDSRHARSLKKSDPIENSMTLEEANAFIERCIQGAVENTLNKQPTRD